MLFLMIGAFAVIYPAPSHADLFLFKNKKVESTSEEDKPRRVFAIFDFLKKDPNKTKQAPVRSSLVNKAKPADIYGIEGLVLPEDFDVEMLSPSGPEPKTERDLAVIAFVKKQGQIKKMNEQRTGQ